MVSCGSQGDSVAVPGCGSGGLDGVEADGETECIGLSDDAQHRAFGIEPSEVVAAEIVVVDVVGQHAPDRGEDQVFDGDKGFRLSG